MKKVYEAYGEDKRKTIEEINNIDAERHAIWCEVDDLCMVTRLSEVPKNGIVDSTWSLNSIETDASGEKDILVIDPLRFHIKDEPNKVGIIDTSFGGPIKLSSQAAILMPREKYIDLGMHLESRRSLRNLPISLYEGEEDLALKMLMYNKGFIHIDISKGQFVGNDYNRIFIDSVGKTIDGINKMEKEKDVKTYNIKRSGSKRVYREKPQEAPIEEQKGDYRIISGKTTDTEGDIELGDELNASTDIGKVRNNQEDAVLLIRDKNNPDFKMMVVADGMGGHSKGEVASNTIVEMLKDWFMQLTDEQKACYETSVDELREDLLKQINESIIPSVKDKTSNSGGSTLVCAIVGKNDTMVLNVGDSRAYIAKDGDLKQISREDTLTQEKLELGRLPNKDIARFDPESNQILQSIGIDYGELPEPYVVILDNDSYDILLLLSDGVSDCLSDEDLIAVCKNTDRRELAKRIVEKALRHDSILPDEYKGKGLVRYKPGGGDNATAAAFTPKKDDPDDPDL